MNNKLLSIIAVFIGLFLPMKMQAQANISAPLFSFVGDSLHMYCDTQGADIYYAMSEYANEEEAESLRDNMYVGMNNTLYTEPFLVTSNVVIKAVAMVPGIQGESEYTTLVYDYTAWHQLFEAIKYGSDVLAQAQNNTQVSDELKNQLQWAIEESNYFYNERGMMGDSSEAEHWTNQIIDYASQIEDIIGQPTEPEPYAVLSDNNTVLTFYYDDQKAARNGMDIGPFSGLSNRSWESWKGSITSVVFDPSFANCNSITSTRYWFDQLKLNDIIGIENLNTENVTDMSSMFRSCGITSLDLSHFDTRNVTNMDEMFSGCNVTSLDLSSFDTRNVTSMNSMFSYCFNLTSLDISSFDTRNVTDMGSMFASIGSLASLDLNNFDTSNVTNMKFMFQSCYIGSLDLSHLDTGNVTDMSGMFNDSKFTTLDLSHFDTRNVTTMSSMFSWCTELTFVDVSGFDTRNVTEMSAMFDHCYALTSLNLSHFNTEKVTNMESMFDWCQHLTTLDISGFDTKNVTTMRGMFSLCNSLTTIYVGNNWSTENVTGSNEMFMECRDIIGGAGTHYDENHVDASYAHIDGGTANPGYFTDKNATPTHLVTMAIGENGVTEATIEQPDGTMTEMVFAAGTQNEFDVQEGSTVRLRFLPNEGYEVGDVLLNGVSVKDQMPTSTTYVIEKVTDKLALSVVYAPLQPEPYAVLSGSGDYVLTFRYDKNRSAYRESMSVGPFISSNNQAWYDQRERITTVVFDASFADCTDLTSTANWFYECINLTTIEGIDNLKTDNVTDMSFMFSTCHSLKSLDLNTFNTSKAENMAWMFDSCTGLTSLDLSNFNTANVTNMNGMFYGCSALETIYAGEGWNASKVGSNPDMFKDCAKLVGGAGTAYSADHTDAAYAHIDGGTANPGYLTSKNAPAPANAEPYAVLSDNNTVLTFYYDDKKAERNGMDVGPFDRYNYESERWGGHAGEITTVVFDESFANCSTLTSTAYWFVDCEQLTNISGCRNLKTDNVTDMTWMFFDCSKLTSLDVSGFKTDKVTSMGRMFYNCSSLINLDVSGFKTDNVTDLWAIFEGCSNLTSLDLSGFKTDNATDLREMFSGCSSLISLDLSNFKTDKVTYMRAMFYDCLSLTSLDVSGFNTDNVTSMQMMFEGCSSLRSLDVSGFNTDNVTEMDYMFSRCSTLTNIDLSNFNTSKVEEEAFTGIFADCTSLASIQAGSANIPAEEYARIGNPNLLVYVNEPSLAPEGIQNVVVNGTAKEIVLTDVTEGNNNWNCPEPFLAEKISYTRNFKQQTEVGISRGWEGIALPFNVQTITHETKGQIVPFGAPGTGVKYFWLRGYSPEGLHRATAIEANTPYLISMPNNPTVYPDAYNLNGQVTFSAENTTVPATPIFEEMIITRGNITMAPIFVVVPQDEEVYAINVGQPRGNYAEGSVFTRNLREVRPFEVATAHEAINGARPNNIRITAQPNYDVTGIKTIENDAVEGIWYSLDGRQMQSQPQRKGVYIQKGKKVMVK